MEYYTGGEMQDIRWYFGDGDSLVSSQGEVIHHYENDGKYPVTFVATDFCGVRDTAIDSIVVNSALGPVTDMISKMTDTVCPGFMFYIVTAALRADTFEWNMNDGTILYGDIISHKYATPGMHYFSLRIANSCQHEVILNDSIYVTTNLKTPLDNIDYQMLTTEPCVGDKFTVLSFPYTNMTYILGDGNTVNEQLDSLINYSESPKLYLGLTGISYSAAGTYDISAAVDNGCGVKDTLELGTLEVVDKSQAQAYISLDFLYESGTIVTYMNKPTTFYVGLSSNYDIDYGDGSSKSFSAGSYTIDKHTYTAEGTYTVSLITTNSCGDRDSTGMIVKVIKDPAGYAGVGEIAVDPMNVEAFPNPTNDVVSFKFDKNITENTAFSIYNLQGQLMHQQNINNANKVDFNFAQYSAGIYIASFVSETQNISKRVMLIK